QLERAGNFSQTYAPSGAVRPIYDPWTTVVEQANNRATRQPFAGNIIPPSRIDPTSARFLQDIWEPNNPGDDPTRVNNYKNTFPRVYEYYNFSDRVDWHINDNWKIFGRFSRLHTNVLSPNPSGSRAGSTGGSERNSLTAAGDAVWSINATTVFNIRGSYNKPVDRFIDPVAEVENYDEFWPGNNWYDEYAKTLPAIYYPGLIVGNSNLGRASWWYSAPDFWNLQSKISMQMGRHYIKAGGEFRRYRGNSGFFQPTEFRFSPAMTADTFIQPDTRQRGDAWASMLLGAMENNTRIRTSPLYGIHNNFYGAYIQDDFKINQKWTLNFGLRYEFDSDIVDNENRLTRTLDLDSPIPEFQGAGAPQLPAEVRQIRGTPPEWNGEWIFTDEDHRGGYHSPRLTLLPRVGLAYRVNDTTSLRFGYARYAIPPSVNNEGGLNLNDTVPYPGYENESFPLPSLEGIPQARFNDPFPSGVNPLNPVPAKSYGRYTNLGTTANSPLFFQDLKNAYNDRFNFSYQTQIPGQIVVDATYFLSIGSNHYMQYNINQTDPRYSYEYKAALSQRVPNPFFNALTPDKFPGALRNQEQVTVGSLLRPYPHYGDITLWHYPGVHRRYQALQLKAQRPFVNGFNFLIGYNYHRAGNDEFYDEQDRFDGNLTFLDSSDRRHKFNATGIVELPFGRGKRFFGGMNRVLDAVAGGWSVSGIYQYISGQYLRFSGMQFGGGDPTVENPSRNQWFDTSKFSQLQPFTRRSNPLQFSGLTGPRISTIDATMSKNFKLTERIAFELRIEAYNLANVMVQGDPTMNVLDSRFGRITTQRGAYFGRQIQYNGRIRW
ncbi:MAG: TonB-dependent receptor domain-containing protein, partial [Bryobacteraceae bacterium]